MQITNCDHNTGVIKSAIIMSRKDAKRFVDPKTTDRVKKNIIKKSDTIIFGLKDENSIKP